MFKSYIKIAWRNLLRNKGFSAINILGLAIGMASAILILLWIQNEMSHDRFHEKRDRLYTANNRDKFNGEMWAWSQTSKPLAGTLKQEYPEVEDAVRIGEAPFLFTVGNKHLNMAGYFTDPGFFNLFSFPLLEGNTKALNGRYNIVLTQKAAIKLFGNEDAMGKTVKIDSTDIFTVSGVLKDLPNNTGFDFEYLLPWSYMTKIGYDDHIWGNNSVETFILLKPGVSQASFDAKIKNITINHNKDGEKATTQVFTQLFSDAYLYHKAENGKFVGGRIERVKLFGIIAAFILLIACINFMNLSTARSEKRAKEVGIRKVLGSSKMQVLLKFATEAAIISSFCICLAAIALFTGYLLVPKPSPVFPVEIYHDARFWEVVFGLIVFGILLTSILPSLLISQFKPVQVLKGKLLITSQNLFLRKALIAFQFIVSFILITGSLIVYKQGNFLMNKSRGLDHTAVVAVKFPKVAANEDQVNRQTFVFREKVKAFNWVKDFTMTTDIPEREIETFGGMYRPQYGERDGKAYFRIGGDENYFRFFKIKLLAGRFFSKAMETDQTALILNESAVQKLGYQNPSQVIGLKVNGGKESKTIIGVVSDFHYRSVKVKPVATVFNYQKDGLSYFAVKLDPNDKLIKSHIGNLNALYNRLFPGNPFEYVFLDDAMKQDLEPDLNFARIFGIFSAISILISLIGLLGLVIVDLSQRVKELGIRKVIGAGFNDIFVLMMTKIAAPLVIALLVGIPLAAWGFSHWISGYYVYHIRLTAFYYLIPAILLPFLAALVILLQVAKVNRQKIISSLQHE